MKYPTRLDTVGLTIIALAFTTMRRVGTFLPSSNQIAKIFSWIVPKFIRYHPQSKSMLV